jgi:hypothetical protein
MKRRSTEAAVYRNSPAVTIRWAEPADAPALVILAELDEAPVPAAPLLLAFVDDELWVAMSGDTGETICDPFRPTLEVAVLVRERWRQLSVPGGIRPRLLRALRPRWTSSA